jgi:hypothetical protein
MIAKIGERLSVNKLGKQKLDVEMFNLEKLKYMAVNGQYQSKIVNRYVASENMHGNTPGKVLETVSKFQSKQFRWFVTCQS